MTLTAAAPTAVTDRLRALAGRLAGELRLDLDAGRVVGAHDRHIDLDEAVPQARELARIQREARAAIDAWQAEAYGGR